jgi:integrase
MGIRQLGTNLWRIDAHVRKAGASTRTRETFSGSKRQAYDRLSQLKGELRDNSGPVRTGQITLFHEALDLFDSRTPVPQRRRSQFNQLHKDLGSVRIEALPDALEAYLRALKDLPSATGRPLSDASKNRLMQLVMASINHAVKRELLDRNPITRARFPKFREVARDRVLTVAEYERLMEVLEHEASHLVPVVKYSMQVPCRKSELVAMTVADLDTAQGAIRVRNGTTKNDEGIWKPIPPDMKAYFKAIPEGCPYLFYRRHSGAYKPLGDFKNAWKRCLRLAGIGNFRFHDTRHVSASALLDNGTPTQVVMQVAGWKTDMIKTYYHRAGKSALALVKFSAG